MSKPFRFGLQVRGPIEGHSWTDTARMVEDLGYSSLVVPDHFHDQLAPIAALSAAAAVTTTLKVGALVFGNDYRHPIILAKEMATLDVLSEGRLEFGIGAGWMRTDYEQTGMDYDAPGERIERMQESLDVIRRCWAEGAADYDGTHYHLSGYDGQPLPHAPGGPPIIIGGGGPRMLGVAARNADIVGITANLRSGEIGSDAIADSMPEAYDAKVARVKEAAGDRFDQIELNSLTMQTSITDDRDGQLALFAELFGMPTEVVAQSPALLVGNVDQICETLQERRERWGFSYVVIQQGGGEAGVEFAKVVERLTGT